MLTLIAKDAIKTVKPVCVLQPRRWSILLAVMGVLESKMPPLWIPPLGVFEKCFNCLHIFSSSVFQYEITGMMFDEKCFAIDTHSMFSL